MTYNDSLKAVLSAAAELLKPPARVLLAEWAEENFRLSSEGSAQTGRVTLFPFQREVLEAMAPHSEHENVALMWASQMSKSTLELIFLAHVIAEDPAPVLIVLPDLNVAEAFSRDRIAPMIRDTPALAGKVADARSREGGATVMHRSFRGGHLTLCGANSPAGLASRPIRFLILDEVDRFKPSSGSEGSPSSLAIARTRTFRASRKILWSSSPTIKGESEIEAVYAESDQRVFDVPCPHCGAHQALSWRRVEWPDGAPEAAFYRCAECSEVIGHHHKAAMLSEGCWRAQNPAGRFPGFHLNELYSPWRTWGELAADWERAQGNPERLRAFINTTLAELWDDEHAGNVTDSELLARRESLGPMLPEGAAVITAGVDVQGDRVEVSVLAWGKGEECWLLQHRVIPGDPSGPGLWAALDSYLASTWDHAFVGPVSIHAAAVDSGFHAEAVTRFCDERRGRRVFAVKGQAGPRRVWPKKESKAPKGRVYLIGVDAAKQVLADRLRIADAGPGRVHFPVTVEAEYFSQLTSEYVATTYKRGRPERVWERRKGRRAEALDCWTYAYAALCALRTHGIDPDYEAERIEAIRAAATPARPVESYQVNRSRFVTAAWSR